jgi:hypothetical protein
MGTQIQRFSFKAVAAAALTLLVPPAQADVIQAVRISTV